MEWTHYHRSTINTRRDSFFPSRVVKIFTKYCRNFSHYRACHSRLIHELFHSYLQKKRGPTLDYSLIKRHKIPNSWITQQNPKDLVRHQDVLGQVKVPCHIWNNEDDGTLTHLLYQLIWLSFSLINKCSFCTGDNKFPLNIPTGQKDNTENKQN